MTRLKLAYKNFLISADKNNSEEKVIYVVTDTSGHIVFTASTLDEALGWIDQLRSHEPDPIKLPRPKPRG